MHRLTLVAALLGLSVGVCDDDLEDGVRVTKDIVYGTRDTGGELKLDVYLPPVAGDARPPLVVYIHGGGWSRGDKADARNVWFLTGAGYAVASIQYRFSDVARFPAQVEDCRAAVKFLKDRADALGFDASEYGVIGESAGGHLAALLGTTGPADARPAAVIELFCPTDLVRHVEQTRQPDRQPSQSVQKLVGGDPTADEAARKLAVRASPMTHVSKKASPFLLVHGTADPLVHTDQTSRFAEALRNAGVVCEVEWVEGAGHAGPAFWGPQMQTRYGVFLNRHHPVR